MRNSFKKKSPGKEDPDTGGLDKEGEKLIRDEMTRILGQSRARNSYEYLAKA